MIFDPTTGQHLKPWLVRTLEPICDAEPGALAEYILALLKHNVPENEMRKELAVQLDEFLEKECQPFIDTLFAVLRTKSYVPYSTASGSSLPSKSSDNGIPIPLDSLISPSVPTSPSRTRKRSLDDVGDGRPLAKGPRISGDGNYSRYGNGRGPSDTRAGSWSNGDQMMNGYGDSSTQMRGNGMSYMGNGRRPQAYQPPDMKRGICRDYHNNGYCSRGALCKFSHGEDAVIPGQMFPLNGGPMGGQGLPFMPMFNQFGQHNGPGATYDPRESRMDIRGPMNGRSHMRPAFLPRAEDGSQVVHASGELPVIQDLTPNIPHNEVTPNPHPSQPATSSHPDSSRPSHPSDVVMGGAAPPVQAFPHPSAGLNGDVDMTPPNGRSNFPHHIPRGGRPPVTRGRGTFGDVPSIRPERRRDKTLVVEKIPTDKLSLEHVNDWFKRFGTVTNVAIDKAQAKALVSFSEHEEAHNAWKSEDAVFSNRFVKVFWHRPMEGHGQIGAKMLAASAPLVANMSTKESSVPRPTPPTPSRKSSTPSSNAGAIAAKQKQLEQKIAEQRSLMASLAAATGDEKKNILVRLKELTSSSTPSSSPTPVTAPSGPDDKERKQKDLLDKELELHSAADGEGESAEDLKAKLERLKAEAASLGISDPDTSYPVPYRGRGRGRGAPRGYYRGAIRGGARPSMKLDNRPKQLLVKGVSTQDLQPLKDWYEVDTVTPLPSGDVVVAFRSRAAAEQGMAKGTNVPAVGTVELSWHAGSIPPSKPSNISPEGTSTSSAASLSSKMSSPALVPDADEKNMPHIPDEEVIASGWGGDTEDGMGMF
ncbi:hypothetical protein BDZ89DRAFT_1100620 [Hymenopellis radicata]|nr:hypothetical protein BDZ89DRAFT_1100620 [Hymenopellis radicata]